MSSQGSNSSYLSFGDCKSNETDGGDCNKIVATFLKIFDREEDHRKKLEYVQHLVGQCLPIFDMSTIEKEFFQHVIPSIKNLCTSMFEKCASSVEANCIDKNNDTVTFLKQYLMMGVDLLAVLDKILLKLMEAQRLELCSIQSVILGTCNIVFSTFQHCKESEKIYKCYFDELEEILTLFKKNQDVHAKLLRIFDGHVKIDHLNHIEILIFHEVLEIFESVGEILVGVNVKTFADNWKCYTTLLQKHAQILSRDFNLRQPTCFMCQEILRTLRLLFETDLSDAKAVTNNLKVGNFMVKVISKITESLSDSFPYVHEILWDFFIEVYYYSYPYLCYRKCPENITGLVETLILIPIEKFCVQLLKETDFIKALTERNLTNINDNEMNFLLLALTILENIPKELDTQKVSLYAKDILKLVCGVFSVFQKCYSQLFQDILIRSENGETSSVYNKLVTNLAVIVIVLPQNEYVILEELLLNIIVNGNVWSALLASDVWILSLKHSNPQFSFDTLCKLIDVCSDILKQNISKTDDYQLLRYLIKRMYGVLNGDHKMSFATKYELTLTNAHIWKCVGLDNLPDTHTYFIECLVIKFIKLAECFTSGNVSADEFFNMCSTMDMLASRTLVTANVNTKQLLTSIMTLWTKMDESSDLMSGTLFKLFYRPLCKLTSAVIERINNADVLIILKKLSVILSDEHVKIVSMYLLQNLSTCIERFSNDSNFGSIICTIFMALFKDKNPIVRQKSYDIFSTMRTNMNALQFHGQLKSLINMIAAHEREMSEKKPIFDEYYCKHLAAFHFNHKCVQWSSCFEPLFKKIKCDEPEEPKLQHRQLDTRPKAVVSDENRSKVQDFETSDADDIIDEMKKYVKSIMKVRKENLTPKNLSDIRSIINQLHLLT